MQGNLFRGKFSIITLLTVLISSLCFGGTIILKPENNNLTYYFTAAWEQERGGIKSKEEFLKYLDDELIKLNNTIKVVLN